MKRVRTSETIHKSMPEKMQVFTKYMEYSGVSFVFKLADRMEERNLTVRSLAEITGLRIATISDLMTGKKQSVNLHHILILMVALRIGDMFDLIDIEFPEDKKEEYALESEGWINEGIVPEPTLALKAFLNDDESVYIKHGVDRSKFFK